MSLKIYSGECCLCDVGIPTGEKDSKGNDLFTGDIVSVCHSPHEKLLGDWGLVSPITVTVVNQYHSYTDGSIKIRNEPQRPYVMGIASCGFNHPQWQITRIKEWKYAIDGENWPDYGFSYKNV